MRSCVLVAAIAGAGATSTLPKVGAAMGVRAPPLGAKQLRVRIDDSWIDLTGWRAGHAKESAGEHWLDLFNEQDATDVFHAFHSEKARKQMLGRLPRVKVAEEARELEAACAPVTQLTRDFRAWKAELEAEGWWSREPLTEAATIGLWALTVGAGTACAWSGVPFVSSAAAGERHGVVTV
ncbi:hypothetical protein T492DRAFT_886936 [Pavlovales sp. CCMP2436]|nr:hypothetical protein T492DRAFT_886936 [Pavlovales sp. CCMP2436]